MARLILSRRKLLSGLAASACMPSFRRAAAQDKAQAKGPATDSGAAQAIEVRASALPHFRPSAPGVKRFGDLEFRGGLVLTSPSERFGGWSGLVMGTDGRRLLAISDVGSWMSADVAYDDAGAPAAFASARIGPLLGEDGRPLRGKREQDAESVALVDGTLEQGTLLIGFERRHRIGRFPVRGGEVQAPSGFLPLPGEADSMPPNEGIEAIAVLQSGPLRGSPVAFAERLVGGDGYHTGWIWVEGQPRRIQLQDIEGFAISDAAGLPDGGLLILERFYEQSADGRKDRRMRIRRLSAGEIEPGARLAGHTVVQADSGCEIDNMEGLAVHRGAQAQMVVSLISDDNFNPDQRTVFLQFTLGE
jgi:hypothetical protein